MRKEHTRPKETSWEGVGNWYNELVGEKGHYYHEKIILPNVLRLLAFPTATECSLLDLACGQGVLARQIPQHIFYTGIDLSQTLIKAAKVHEKGAHRQFIIGDVSKPLQLKKQLYTHASIILALQNIENGRSVIQNAADHLHPGGKFVIVLNHPCFRIPRQSSWQIDEQKKTQYRRIDRYSSDMKIPIQAHPGKKEHSPETWSFHHPLSTYSLWLSDAGLNIELIEEWCSDKQSTGKNSKMENRAREEIPMFLTLVAHKR